jgi:hypothetical protein
MSLSHEQTVVIRACMDCKQLLEPPFRVHTGFEASPNTPAMVSHGLCDECADIRVADDERDYQMECERRLREHSARGFGRGVIFDERD